MKVLRDALLPLLVVVLNVWLAGTTGLRIFYLMGAVILALIALRWARPRP